MARIALESLGCKLNQAETESLAWQLRDRGYVIVESAEMADVYVLNTCTVTHVADRKARHLLRLARRANPRATIGATGCYAQRAPGELESLGVVDIVLGNQEKHRLAEVLGGRSDLPGDPGRRIGDYRGRTRSLVKIQEGCSSYCSFCVVPYTRGEERSRPPEEVVEEVRHRVGAGYREVVLTGTKVGAYRWDGEAHSGLARLVAHVLRETGVERLRLSSVQPGDLTPDLLSLWADSRLCPHLHMPLQSGSQAVVERMNRGYSIADYERAVSLARQAVPGLAVTTDVIVGFPGETEAEFEESLRFCRRMGFADIHVFPYSARPGTPAAALPGQVDERVKRDRARRMLELARQSARRFRQELMGSTALVLWEGQVGHSVWSGLTPNYVRVFAESERDLTNRLLNVRLVGEHGRGLLGEVVYGG